MEFTFLYGFLFSAFSATCQNAVFHIFRFIEKMIFMSYLISSLDNSVYTDEIMQYIEQNLVFWQSKTYTILPNATTNKSLIPGQKLQLSPGLYFFWYNYTFMWVYLESVTGFKNVYNPQTQQKQLHIMSLRWNYWSFTNFFKEMHQKSEQRPPAIFTLTSNGGLGGITWEQIGTLPVRKLSSVILPESTILKITKDIESFYQESTKTFYNNRGINYKRGILLYGKPGCGKTSLINAIANEFGLNIYIFGFNMYQTDSSFMSALLAIPGKSIILFEDIDVAFPDPRKKPIEMKEPKYGNSNVTLKGFLNGIDGIKSNNNGVLFFFTTNHPENLDPALLRAGRMDLKVELTFLGNDEIRRMFLLFFPDQDMWAEKIMECLKDKHIVPAEFSEFLIENIYENPKEFIERCKTWGTTVPQSPLVS